MGECIINTPCGRIKGEEKDNIQIFKGIPYAKTERFKYPEMIAHWDGVLDATGAEIDCYQYSSFNDESADENNFYYKEFRSDREFKYAESPMTLNIIVPSNKKDCPVLLFIHGGGFETGTVGELPYGTCIEYAKRGIIFVSIGYRLNIFSLYETKNLGLYDQITAIEWINKNIEAFGGNPNKITLIGQSAGAMSITDLCYTNRLKGLISGAIMMSGGGKVPSFVGPWSKEKNAQYWAKIRENAGVKTEEEFIKLPAETIWHAWNKEARERNNYHLLQPGIDGVIIPDEPSKLSFESHLDVPIIFGVTSQDFLAPILYEFALKWGIESFKYNKQPVYGYFLDRDMPGDKYHAWHGADLWYLFGNMNYSWRPFEDVDYNLSKQMIDYVSNFVKKQNPNSDNLPVWKPITNSQKGFRLFDGNSNGLIYPNKCRLKTIYTMLFDKGPL